MYQGMKNSCVAVWCETRTSSCGSLSLLSKKTNHKKGVLTSTCANFLITNLLIRLLIVYQCLIELIRKMKPTSTRLCVSSTQTDHNNVESTETQTHDEMCKEEYSSKAVDTGARETAGKLRLNMISLRLVKKVH